MGSAEELCLRRKDRSINLYVVRVIRLHELTNIAEMKMDVHVYTSYLQFWVFFKDLEVMHNLFNSVPSSPHHSATQSGSPPALVLSLTVR